MSRRRSVLVAALAPLRMGHNRATLFGLALLPFVVILLLGSGGDAATGDLPVGVVGDEGKPLAGALRDRLDATPGLAVTAYPDDAGLAAAVRRGAEGAGVVVPADYDRALRAGDPAAVTLMVGAQGRAGVAARSAVERAVAAENAVLQASQFAVATLEMPFDQALQAAALVEDTPVLTVVASTGAGTLARAPGRADAAVGILVLFVFVTALTTPAVVDGSRPGVGQRILAAPSSPALVVLGETLGRVAVAGLQGLLVAAGAWLLFGVRWEDPGAVLAVLAVFCLVAAGAAMLLGAAVRCAERVRALSLPLGVGLGILGGCLWSLQAPALRTAARVTPHAWAVQALRGAARAAPRGDLTTPLAVLGVFAVVLLAGGGVLAHRTLVGSATPARPSRPRS